MTTLKKRVEAARSRFEAGARQLYRPDGTTYYSDEEHEERISALRAERDREMREVEEEADRAIAEAEADLATLADGDPTLVLSDAELERANAKRAFAAEDVGVMGYETLARRLEAVKNGGDRASMFAYATAARRRIASTRPAGDDERDQLLALGLAVDELEGTLREGSDAYASKAKAARERMQDAGEAKDAVWLVKNGGATYVPNYAFRDAG